MKPQKCIDLRLKRNLRRSLLQGHPWIYREAIEPILMEHAKDHLAKVPTLARLHDAKGCLAYGIYDPYSPLAFRVLQTVESPQSEKHALSINHGYFEKKFLRAYILRKQWLPNATTAYRLFNGEGDGLPGLICDIYGDIGQDPSVQPVSAIAVLQFDGRGPSEFWDRQLLIDFLSTHLSTSKIKIRSIVEKARRSEKGVEKRTEIGTDTLLKKLWGEAVTKPIHIKEHGLIYEVDIVNGQKTGFFLDQRDNRQFVKTISRDLHTLNLFSYTGGFSIAAASGGARHVTSVDLSKAAIQTCDRAFSINGFTPDRHQGVTSDVFEFLKNTNETWDHIIVDPPSMSHSEGGKDIAMKKYTELFKASLKRVKRNGMISLSSCSSHISFEDFHQIITESLSQARRQGTVLRVSGQDADHPYPNACPEMRYLKFFHLALN